MDEQNMTKNIFLTATAGRSGTGYLYTLFSCVSSVTSVHEARLPLTVRHIDQDNFDLPNLNPWMMSPLDDIWTEKLKEINATETPNYVETNHLINKGWLEQLIYEHNIVPNIITLTRNPRSIAKSFYTLNAIPLRTETGQIHMMSPTNRLSRTTLFNIDRFNDYQLCYWYVLESIARQQHYSKLIANLGGKVYNVDLSNLKEEFLNMLNHFNISYTDNDIMQFNQIKNEKVNERKSEKDDIQRPLTYAPTQLDEFEEDVRNQIFYRHK